MVEFAFHRLVVVSPFRGEFGAFLLEQLLFRENAPLFRGDDAGAEADQPGGG